MTGAPLHPPSDPARIPVGGQAAQGVVKKIQGFHSAHLSRGWIMQGPVRHPLRFAAPAKLKTEKVRVMVSVGFV